MKTAYSIMKNLYSQDTSSYKTKDTFVNMSIDYAKDLIRQNKKYEMANSIMDTLIYLVPNYAIVKDSYLEILLAPFHFEYLFSKEFILQAFTDRYLKCFLIMNKQNLL